MSGTTQPSVQELVVQEEVKKEVSLKPFMKVCFVCGNTNHMAKDCFHKYEGGSRSKSDRSKYSYDKAAAARSLDKLNVAKGTVEGTRVGVLRDQGCIPPFL